MSNTTVKTRSGAGENARRGWRTSVFRFSTALTVVVACLVLVGHFAGIDWLTRMYPDGRITSATTATLFLAIAAATGLVWHGQRRQKLIWVGVAVAGVAIFAGLAILVFRGAGGLLDPAGILRPPGELARQAGGSATRGATALLTTLGIIALGISAAFASEKKFAALSQVLALGALVIALIAAVGYLWGSKWIIENLPAFALLGFPTVVMFFSSSAALIATTGDSGIASEVSSDLVGGRLARRVLPAVLVGPLIFGWLRLLGQELNLYETGFGLSLMVASLIVLGGSIVVAGAHWLNKVDRERTLAEAESLDRASRISDILEGAAEGILTFNSDRQITMANPRAKLAFARHDLINVDIGDVVPSGLEALDELDGSSSRSGFKKDLRMVGETASGRLFPIEGSLAKRSHEGEKTFTLIFRDVSERVKAENRIRALNERLEDQIKKRTEQLNRAAGDLEAFSYSVSHDLRAPLRAMSGFARIITDDFSDDLPPEAHHYLNRIQVNATHMAELIDGLLEFSKIERIAASRDDLDLTILIQEEIDLISPTLGGRDVDFRIGEMPSCNADPVLMRRVIANLLSNAVKFTEDCNPAVIEAGFNEDSAAYFISDNGVGFDDERADRLFEVFQRLHSRDKFPGAGIGLALTRRIVEKHGGSIWAKSRPHRGATFYFSLDEGVQLSRPKATRAEVSA